MFFVFGVRFNANVLVVYLVHLMHHVGSFVLLLLVNKYLALLLSTQINLSRVIKVSDFLVSYCIKHFQLLVKESNSHKYSIRGS